MKYLIIAITFSLLFACQSKDRYKVTKDTFYSQDSLLIENIYIYDSNSVIEVVHYPNGLIKDVLWVKNNELHGPYYRYDSIGSLKSIEHYRYNKLHGIVKNYSSDKKGLIFNEYFYVNNKVILRKESFHSRDLNYFKIETYKVVNKSLILCGVMVYDKNLKIIKDMSRDYYANLLDTINTSGKISFSIENFSVYSWNLNLKLGELDTLGNLLNVQSEFSGINEIKDITVNIKDGYNLITGLYSQSRDTIINNKKERFTVSRPFYKEIFAKIK